MPPAPPSPDDLITASTTVDRLIDIGKWVFGALGLGGVWVWRVSKEHAKFQALNDTAISLRGDLTALEERVDRDFLSKSSHATLQMACQEHIHRITADKLHEALKDISDTNQTAIKEIRDTNQAAIKEIRDASQTALSELREENKKIFQQNAVMTANLSILMVRFGVAPVDSQEKRRATDPHE